MEVGDFVQVTPSAPRRAGEIGMVTEVPKDADMARVRFFDEPSKTEMELFALSRLRKVSLDNLPERVPVRERMMFKLDMSLDIPHSDEVIPVNAVGIVEKVSYEQRVFLASFFYEGEVVYLLVPFAASFHFIRVGNNDYIPGQCVRITRSHKSMSEGWQNIWGTDLDKCVGKLGVVLKDDGDAGIVVGMLNNYDTYHFPTAVLDVVDDRAALAEADVSQYRTGKIRYFASKLRGVMKEPDNIIYVVEQFNEDTGEVVISSTRGDGLSMTVSWKALYYDGYTSFDELSYIQNQRTCGLKINDLVVITKPDSSVGWRGSWSRTHDMMVGRMGRVTRLGDELGMEVGTFLFGPRLFYPYQALRKLDRNEALAKLALSHNDEVMLAVYTEVDKVCIPYGTMCVVLAFNNDTGKVQLRALDSDKVFSVDWNNVIVTNPVDKSAGKE